MKRYFIILTLVVACATLIYSCIGSVENTESLNTENAEKQSKEAGKKIDSTEITHGEFASRVFKVHTVVFQFCYDQFRSLLANCSLSKR